jgi:hypothetical protein
MMVDQEALSTAAVTAASNTEAPAAAPETTPSLTELDGLSEFTFQGEKYTPDQLHKFITEHKSFSEQASEYKKEKEYADNLQIDLDNVLADPRLAEKFKATYPKKYHAVLDGYLRTNGQAPAQSNPAQPASLPKEFLNDFNLMRQEMQTIKQREFENATAAASAKIDAILPKLLEKYPMAIEDQVYSRAEKMLHDKQVLNEQAWERLVRESHNQFQKRADRVYGEKMKSQLEKGQRGADSGPGGASPGQAPVKPRTFAEAQAAMMEHVRQTKGIG